MPAAREEGKNEEYDEDKHQERVQRCTEKAGTAYCHRLLDLNLFNLFYIA
jgi:hypothetical protein